MSVLRGAAVGALSLTMLDVLVGTDQAADRAGGLLTGVAGLARAFMSADVPAIRDRSGCLDNPNAKTHSGGGDSGRRVVQPFIPSIHGVTDNPFLNPAGALAKRLFP